MLSRVAENVYWLARYLERAEGTARLISASSLLQLDLPMSVPLSWASMVEILGSQEAFDASDHDDDEKGVMRYLISDATNTTSIFSCVRHARENARTSRDMLPSEVWETTNALYLFVKDNASGLTSRRKRHDFLQTVIDFCQQIAGIMHGCVTRGLGHEFLTLGRYLERADMTTRIIDVRYGNLFPLGDDTLDAYSGVCWMSVLKSLSAYEMYRHDVTGRISGPEVTNYLIKGKEFPRAVAYSVYHVEECLNRLPNGDDCLEEMDLLRAMIEGTELTGMSPERMHTFIDDVQRGLVNAHRQIINSYFRFHGSK